jgi:hypothetical protein
MYIKEGTTRVTYGSPSYDDFMIFAEIVDSQMSYERPVLVRTRSQLYNWFGKEFSSKAFFDELLDYGISLYLTRPVSAEEDQTDGEYLDINSYYQDLKLYESEPEMPSVKEGETEIKRLYNMISEGGEYISEGGSPYDKFIWYYEPADRSWSFTKVKDLPQNISGFRTDSLNNRDTLNIYSKNSKFSYCNPGYKDRSNTLQLIKDTFGKDFKYSLSGLNLERVNKGLQTLAFDITSKNTTLKSGNYIIIQGNDGVGHLYYYREKPKAVSQKYYRVEEEFTSISDLLRRLKNIGYLEINGTLYSTFPTRTTYFFDIPGFQLEPSYIKTHILLGELGEEEELSIRFYSKTIGPGGEEGNISVSLTKLEEEGEYRVEISRFDYTEVYEGFFIDRDEVETERLDYSISKYSSLVYCETVGDHWIEPNEGTWELRGAVEETHTSEKYMKSLSILFNDRDDLCLPDFLLIPDVEKYGTEIDEDTGSLKSYETFLRYSKDLGTQILVENSMEDIDNPKHYKFNYVEDKENRIVYFLNKLTLGGEERPGYYAFLIGLIGDTYSISTSYILYSSPTDGKNPYTTDLKDLEEKKCNYLVDNNQVYYYKKYFGGKNPTTSVLGRFVIGKISRELKKNKWYYLSTRMNGRIEGRIEGVLGRIVNSFSIIRSIGISEFNYDYTGNKITLEIESTISDLIDKDIKLDITINYIKY